MAYLISNRRAYLIFHGGKVGESERWGFFKNVLPMNPEMVNLFALLSQQPKRMGSGVKVVLIGAALTGIYKLTAPPLVSSLQSLINLLFKVVANP
ncbi:hypothetical protein CRG98_042365 [Punica granatum]|uniref:Uncharacterized protein n=1 Tax=Punica granatum TaxID=22663 RepID=A0A2I0HZV2_PUNGR|nr:hypothetical protein CRG98_042365 [Punica granatum]